MLLPIEIINEIAKHTDINTFNSLKCCSSECDRVIQNYELLRRESAKKINKIMTHKIGRIRYYYYDGNDDEFDLWCARDMLGIFQFSFLKEHTDESDESDI